MTAVVPAHRCGAVPDSHRVPSCDAARLADGANRLRWSAYGVNSVRAGPRSRRGPIRGRPPPC